MTPTLWHSDDTRAWRTALDSYESVVAAQKSATLPAVDRWFRDELPAKIAARRTPHVTLDELARMAEWKMLRGVWRARNLALIRGNDPALVIETSTAALAARPHPTTPIKLLSELEGVGPATASAVASAASPEIYPFFDELVGAQVPRLGTVTFTLGYYAKYADALRARADTLGKGWTPVMVERALWAHVGGKAGSKR
jgi:hypothetical protein